MRVNITPRRRSAAWQKKHRSKHAHQVRYRTGGRYTKLQDGGTFVFRRQAEERARFIENELYNGRDPQIVLDALAAPTPLALGLAGKWDEWDARQAGLDEKTRRSHRTARNRILPLLGERTDPATVTDDMAQKVIDALKADGIQPSTLRKYLTVPKMVLDHCKVRPNPFSSPALDKPKAKRKKMRLPQSGDFAAILGCVAPPRGSRHTVEVWKLAYELTEALGLRNVELLGLECSGIDVRNGRILVWKTKDTGEEIASGVRWLPIPQPLLERLLAVIPADANPEHRVFAGMTWKALDARLAAACKLAGTPPTTLHKLRHRRISFWVSYKFDVRQVADWAGHSKPSMTTDVYSHVMDADDDAWKVFWHAEYAKARGVPMLRVAGEGAA